MTNPYTIVVLAIIAVVLSIVAEEFHQRQLRDAVQIQPPHRMTTQTIMTQCSTVRAIREMYEMGFNASTDADVEFRTMLDKRLAGINLLERKHCSREQSEVKI